MLDFHDEWVKRVHVTSPYLDTGQRRALAEEVIVIGKALGIPITNARRLHVSARLQAERNRDWKAIANWYPDTKKATIYLSATAYYNQKYRIESLLHELTHIKQYLTGRLVDTDDFVVFDGVLFEDASVESLLSQKGIDGYKKLPFEAEAFDNEKHYKAYLMSKALCAMTK